MNKLDIVYRYLPSPKKTIQSRREIKAIHIENLQRLKNSVGIKTEFPSENEAVLGEFAGRKHFDIIAFVQDVGYRSDDKTVKIHGDDNVNEVKKRTKSVIWRIRIKNLVSFSIWLLILFGIVGVFGFTSGIISDILTLI